MGYRRGFCSKARPPSFLQPTASFVRRPGPVSRCANRQRLRGSFVDGYMLRVWARTSRPLSPLLCKIPFASPITVSCRFNDFARQAKCFRIILRLSTPDPFFATVTGIFLMLLFPGVLFHFTHIKLPVQYQFLSARQYPSLLRKSARYCPGYILAAKITSPSISRW